MASPSEMLFGKLAVMNKMVTPLQVEECIQLQEMFAKTGMELSLGEICIKKKYLVQAQVDQVLKAQQYLEMRKEDVRFGEIAVSNGFVSHGQVAECLQLQETVFKKGQDPVRIGQVLLEKAYLNQQQVIACLKAQARMAENQTRVNAATPAPAPPVASPAVGLPPPRSTTASRAPTRVIPSPVVGPPPGRQKTSAFPAVGRSGAPAPPAEPPGPGVAAVPPELAKGVSVDGCTVAAHGSVLTASGNREMTVLIVEVEGVLDGHTFPYFEEYMNKAMDAGYANFVIDCKKLEYISSPGIGVLVGAARRCRESQGDIRLCSLPPNILQVISLLGFQNIIRSYDHEYGAINSYKYM